MASSLVFIWGRTRKKASHHYMLPNIKNCVCTSPSAAPGPSMVGPLLKVNVLVMTQWRNKDRECPLALIFPHCASPLGVLYGGTHVSIKYDWLYTYLRVLYLSIYLFMLIFVRFCRSLVQFICFLSSVVVLVLFVKMIK